jgi:hypothetical protein
MGRRNRRNNQRGGSEASGKEFFLIEPQMNASGYGYFGFGF